MSCKSNETNYVYRRIKLLLSAISSLAFLACSNHANLPTDDDPKDEEGCYLKDSGEPLRISTVGVWKPWNFEGDDGKLTGFDMDYMDKVLELTGLSAEYHATSWGGGCCNVDENDPSVSFAPGKDDEGLLPGLFRGEADVAISIMSDSDRRIPHFPTSTRYGFGPNHTAFNFDPSDRLFGEEPGDVVELKAALAGKSIGVQAPGTNQDFYLKLLAAEEDVSFSIKYADALASEMSLPADTPPGEILEQAVQNSIVNASFGDPLPDTELVSEGFVTQIDRDRFSRVWGTGGAVFFNPNIEDYRPGLIQAVNCAIGKISNDTEFFDGLVEKYGVKFCNPILSDEECLASLDD